MEVRYNTSKWQRALVHLCRSGECDPRGALMPQSAQIYADLVFQSFERSLRNALPLTRRALSEEEWLQLIADYLLIHPSSSPKLWRLPLELYRFVLTNKRKRGWWRPYLVDLVLFEWSLIEIDRMEDRPIPLHSLDGDLLRDPLLLNPHASLLTFSYPVFRGLPPEGSVARSYYLLIYRRPETFEVEIIELSALFAKVILLLQKRPLSGQKALNMASSEFSGLDQRELALRGGELLSKLLEKRALLGFANTFMF